MKNSVEVAKILGLTNQTINNRARRLKLNKGDDGFEFTNEQIEDLINLPTKDRITVNQKHEIVRLFFQGGDNCDRVLAEKTGTTTNQVQTVLKKNIQGDFFVIKSKI